MKRVAGYIPGGADAEKRSVIEEYCLKNDMAVEWIESRDGFGEIAFGDWMTGRKVNAVIVADSSDVSEDFYEYHAYGCILKRRHSELIAVRELFGKRYAVPEAVIRTFVDKLCEVELKNKPIRKPHDRTDKAARGQYIGGNAPMGYKVQDGRLVINPDEVSVVLMVMDRKHSGKTMLSTVDALNQGGYRTRKGGKFVISTVQSIWNNEMFYRGYYRYSKSGGNGEWVKGEHEPILKD